MTAPAVNFGLRLVAGEIEGLYAIRKAFFLRRHGGNCVEEFDHLGIPDIALLFLVKLGPGVDKRVRLLGGKSCRPRTRGKMFAEGTRKGKTRCSTGTDTATA